MALLLVLSVVVHADILNFYKKTLKTLQYNKTYSLYRESNIGLQESINARRYANLSLDINYAKSRATTLLNPFNTTDISLNDTVDLFGKGSYKVEELALELKVKKGHLDIQKEQLFITLVEMIRLYHQTKEQLSLRKNLLNQQQNIYDKLQKLHKIGAVSQIDLLQFKNNLIWLKREVITKESSLKKMEKELHLYASDQNIPSLNSQKLLYSKDRFISHNPQAKINEISAKQRIVQANSAKHLFLPDVVVGVAYQQLDDPTSYGDNYSFKVGIHMPLNLGDFKQSEALRVNALSLKAKAIEYKLQREREYIKRYYAYQDATKQLKVLYGSLDDYEKSEETMRRAFLKQYVDFNRYLQVLRETLNIKEQIIQLKYQKNAQAIIINMISSGAVYE